MFYRYTMATQARDDSSIRVQPRARAKEEVTPKKKSMPKVKILKGPEAKGVKKWKVDKGKEKTSF